MKRCDLCIYWIPRTDIGYCKKSGEDNVDADDCCDKYMTEEELRNHVENCPKPGDNEKYDKEK